MSLCIVKWGSCSSLGSCFTACTILKCSNVCLPRLGSGNRMRWTYEVLEFFISAFLRIMYAILATYIQVRQFSPFWVMCCTIFARLGGYVGKRFFGYLFCETAKWRGLKLWTHTKYLKLCTAPIPLSQVAARPSSSFLSRTWFEGHIQNRLSYISWKPLTS